MDYRTGASGVLAYRQDERGAYRPKEASMAAKMKKDWSLVIWVFGWLLSLATAIKRVASKLGVPFEALEYLASEKGENTLEKVMKLLVHEWRESEAEVLERQGHRIVVDHDRLPLAVMPPLLFYTADQTYFNGQCRWRDTVPGRGSRAMDRLMTIVAHRFEADTSLKDILLWGVNKGFHPADVNELCAYALDKNAPKPNGSCIAVGSTVGVDGGNRYAATREGMIYTTTMSDTGNCAYYFLFVRRAFR